MNRPIFYTVHKVYNVIRNSKNIHSTKRREVWGISMKDFEVHWFIHKFIQGLFISL